MDAIKKLQVVMMAGGRITYEHGFDDCWNWKVSEKAKGCHESIEKAIDFAYEAVHQEVREHFEQMI